MSTESVSKEELVRDYGATLIKRKAEGVSTLNLAHEMAELIGRPCSEWSVRKSLEILGVIPAGARASNLKMVDATQEESVEYPIEDLIASSAGKQTKESKAARHRRTIELPAEPVGIMCFGDPHVDNEGCDWAQLYDHVSLGQRTEGVLAACVGDMQDNWIGRLARIYSESSCTASDGWRLSEWFLSSMQWIAMVGGNHDAWAHGPGVDPMKWLTDKCGVMCYAPDEIRISLTWRGEPELEPVVWVLRHDFGGRSWYHPTHGPHKEAMLDGKCHILTAGHIHQWGELTTEQRHGRVTNAIRVRGYKRQDAFAISKGFSEQTYGEAALIVIDPFATGPGRVTVFWDLERGCEFLTFLRGRK